MRVLFRGQVFALQASELALLVEATANPGIFKDGLLHDPNKQGRCVWSTHVKVNGDHGLIM